MSALSARAFRYVLLVCGCLGAILLFLLAMASANTGFFAGHYDLLVVFNGAIVLLLTLLVGRELWRLARSHRRAVFGSRLAVRLVLLFGLMAVLPGALLYGVSMTFLGRSIESWFDVRVDKALEGGLNLGRGALDYLQRELEGKALQIALDLADEAPGALSVKTAQARERGGVGEVTVFDGRGRALAFATGPSAATTLEPEPLSPQALRRARLQQSFAEVETRADGGLLLRAFAPVASPDPTDPVHVLRVVQAVPRQLQEDIQTVQSGYRDYQELSFLRTDLKRLYGLTLTLTLLLALLSALALAVVLSERLAKPLGLLAEGTRAVAEGDFTRRQPVVSRDELGVLTASFNTMTEQLAQARSRAEQDRLEIQSANVFLENILRSLSTGVLAFDRGLALRIANPAASVILQQPLSSLLGRPVRQWADELPALAELAGLVAQGFENAGDAAWQRQADVVVHGNRRVLLVRGIRLPRDPNEGAIVVFDDISELLHAQREAAWAEVARRLAHEIKNPLTPIQLSAERLQVKLAEKLPAPESEVLRRGTQTIVTQVAAMKNMVDDFSVYARQPRPGAMQPLDVNALLLDVLGLYENQRPFIVLQLTPEPAIVQGEPTRLRQVFHNLLQNALDALADVPEPRIQIATEVREGWLYLSITDNGSGFPPEMLDRVFEPYVTTKPKGTGLGLAIVKKILDEHEGRVQAENVQPHGARVGLALPLARARA